MIRRPPRSTRTDTLFPYTTLFRSGALKHGQVWLTLAVGAIGFGGLFAVYTYLADTLMQVTQVSPEIVPLVLAIFGIGMTVGNIVVPKLADHSLIPTIGGVLIWSAATTALFSFTASSLFGIPIPVFSFGLAGPLATLLQTR